MAELTIEVTGCGYDGRCVGTFARFSSLIGRWYGDRVSFTYQDNPDITGDPLIIVKAVGQEVHRWNEVPTVDDLRTYLTGQLGMPIGMSRRPGPASVGRNPPW